MKLRGFFLHMVMPKQPARLLHTPNRTGFGGRHGVLVTTGNHVTNPLVRPVPVMMIGDGFANMTDSVLINQNEAIHNRPDLAHEPLNERRLPEEFRAG